MPVTHHRNTRIVRLAVWVIAVASAVAAGWLISDSLRLALTMPAQLNYVDGYMVDDAIRLAAGEALYPDPSSAPFTVSVYTPLFAAVLAGLLNAGVDGFAAGRLLVFGSTLCLAALVFALGSRRSPWVALLIACGFLFHPLQWPWSLVIRPDVTAVLLSACAVVVASRLNPRHGWWIAALLCLTAGLTKQTSVAAPAAIMLWSLTTDRRWAIRFAATLASAAAAAVALLQWTTDGQFLFHTVVANVNRFSADRAAELYRQFLTAEPLLILAVVVLVGHSLRTRKLSIFGVFAVCSLALAWTSGKVGSSMNYFLEPLAAVAMWTAADFPVRWFDRRRPVRMLTAGLVIAIFAVTSATSLIRLGRAHDVARSMVSVHSRLVETLAAVDGPVVSDDAAALIGAGKRVHFRPFIMSQLAYDGRWDQAPFVRELADGRIPMVVVRTEPREIYESRYTPEMRRAIDDGYSVAFQYLLGARYTVLTPSTHSETSDSGD